MCYNMLHKKRWGIFMSIFDRDNKNELDEKRYKEILAEEDLEEEYFNRKQSFDKIDNKIKEKEEEEAKEYETEEFVDDVDYDEYSNDYAAFNSINENYDAEEEAEETNNVSVEKTSKTKTTKTKTTTTISNEEYENADDGYTLDRSLAVSLVSNIYKWFVRIAAVLAILLILYLFIKAKFIAVFLYIISLVCAFLFGYIVMFAVNFLFFKE